MNESKKKRGGGECKMRKEESEGTNERKTNKISKMQKEKNEWVSTCFGVSELQHGAQVGQAFRPRYSFKRLDLSVLHLLRPRHSWPESPAMMHQRTHCTLQLSGSSQHVAPLRQQPNLNNNKTMMMKTTTMLMMMMKYGYHIKKTTTNLRVECLGPQTLGSAQLMIMSCA